jgi:hypothetical protein
MTRTPRVPIGSMLKGNPLGNKPRAKAAPKGKPTKPKKGGRKAKV